MSADTPRPERETLTDEEREALLSAAHEARMARLVPTVETILAAREQALRDQIAGEIDTKYRGAQAGPHRGTYLDGYLDGLDAAERIARDGAR